jgi:hypothetical protein
MASDSPLLVDALAEARQALERGDYGRVLRRLEPLVASHPAATPQGAQLQLLMATAWMGHGQADRAIACCQAVRACGDALVRTQARDLLEVLQAPVLRRPREWSLTLPPLSEAPPLEGWVKAGGRGRAAAKPEPPPAPPVGPTRAPFGFALVVLVVLALLAFLLGGCGQVRAELQFHGPGRLQVGFVRQAPAAPAMPWQQRFMAGLLRQGFSPAGAMAWRGPVLPADRALDQLSRSLVDGARLAGFSLPPPTLAWHERNWLVGVQQRLSLQLDLQALEPLPGLELAVDLAPLRAPAVRHAQPRPVQELAGPGRHLRWPLQAGSSNRLELRCWRWSPLGLGALAVLLALALVSLLLRLRRALGFGLPELPA